MPLFLYRTKDTDEDGDHLDFGVCRADTLEEAGRLIDERLQLIHGEDSEPLPFMVYFLVDNGSKGVMSDDGHTLLEQKKT